MTKSTADKIAVITGAAGGLGTQFSHQLADQGYSLLLVDRDENLLVQLAQEVIDRFQVKVETRVVNLVDDVGVKDLARYLTGLSNLSLLVNNAGFGQSKYFVDIDMDNHFDMINLHVHAPVRLCHAVLPGMIERNQGAIINVASLSAWTPCAGIVQYSATKQYLVSFSEAVNEELKGTAVKIQALCPAFVRTKFFETAEMDLFEEKKVPRWLWIESEEVVRQSLRQLASRRVIVIPGLACRILGRLMRMPLAQPIVRRLATNKRKADLTKRPAP
jgi:short-subunit dehydrogenase